ncbi:hypothetical protein PROFUN_15979 [Planoprotostelium fungivorum]|uniref:Ankyrin repeat protein n=1 Tax=Planoprotostelium fungivorum TaxID=1890364 RepID=A0A2P6MTV3_9EUKA|nr:hypothetical protein PROFUN_15979 [Planoprotostelium fungivorum]
MEDYVDRLGVQGTTVREIYCGLRECMVDVNGITVLHLACLYSREDVIRANIHSIVRNGCSPLQTRNCNLN